MAEIVKYTTQQAFGAQASSTPIRSYTGAALEGLGNAMAEVGAQFSKMQEQKEDFKAKDGYRKLQLQLANDMDTRTQSIAEDGTGFHDGFMKEVYTPARDKFLQSLPKRLQEQYGTLLGEDGSDTAEWSIRGATKERDQLYSWYGNQIGTSNEELATAIAMDPDGYDNYLKQGTDLIDQSGLPSNQKVELARKWEHMAQLSFLNRQIEMNPEGVLKQLGADPRYLTPETQFSMLKKAVVFQESRGKANAISPKGAVGLMQVMPRTAVEISKELGDGLVSADMSDERITSIISNPTTNERYGEYYLRKMIRTYGSRGGVEAALIAYNGGGRRAEEWIKSGFDDSVLPAETRKYYKNIMARLPTSSPGTEKGDPSSVRIEEGKRKGLAVLTGKADSKLNKDLTDRVQTAFAGLGINRVKVNSGFRDAAENARVGGAKGSQHKHGNAMDIDVTGYSVAERVKVIEALSAAGITGLGIGTNIIHADVGGRRAWGYKTSAGGGEVPKWASEAIARHLSNTSVPPKSGPRVSGRFSTLPYSDRQTMIAKADQALTQRATEERKQNVVLRSQLETNMRNELATLAATGATQGRVEDTAVSTVLGEERYLKWVNEKELALRTYNATDGLDTASPQEMEDRVTDYAPDPQSPTFADDQKVAAAVQKKVDTLMKERASTPDKAAMRYPDVKEAYDAVMSAPAPTPAEAQNFVRLMLEKQKEFGIKPGSERPVPRAWAMQIGASLSRIPEIKGNNLQEVNAGILAQYESLQEVFGEYTDEVIINALATYKGVGPNTATVIDQYMKAIQAGGDPLAGARALRDGAQDRDQVESVSNEDPLIGGPAKWISSFFNDAEPDDPGEAVPNTPSDQSVDEDLVQRAMNVIGSVDELLPGEEAILAQRFGRSVVDAAKERLKSR